MGKIEKWLGIDKDLRAAVSCRLLIFPYIGVWFTWFWDFCTYYIFHYKQYYIDKKCAEVGIEVAW